MTTPVTAFEPTDALPLPKANSMKSFAPKARSEAEMREAAEEFEAVFISQMLTHMFDGIETDELFGGGKSEEIYKSFMIDEYGKIMSRAGGIGIADQMMRQLLLQQNTQPAGGSNE